MLVSSWQRLELECWPILLEEVQGKYETNAEKVGSTINMHFCFSLLFLDFWLTESLTFAAMVSITGITYSVL